MFTLLRSSFAFVWMPLRATAGIVQTANAKTPNFVYLPVLQAA
jgi:hypothetical protein